MSLAAPEMSWNVVQLLRTVRMASGGTPSPIARRRMSAASEYSGCSPNPPISTSNPPVRRQVSMPARSRM